MCIFTWHFYCILILELFKNDIIFKKYYYFFFLSYVLPFGTINFVPSAKDYNDGCFVEIIYVTYWLYKKIFKILILIMNTFISGKIIIPTKYQ